MDLLPKVRLLWVQNITLLMEGRHLEFSVGHFEKIHQIGEGISR